MWEEGKMLWAQELPGGGNQGCAGVAAAPRVSPEHTT